MEINHSNPMEDIHSCEPHERGRILDRCVGRFGTRNAIHSYMDHDQHKDADGNLKTISEMVKEFRGLVSYKSFIKTVREAYPTLYGELKEIGGLARE